MTSEVEYRQKRNTANRKHGGLLACPTSGDVLYRTEVGWHCPSCGWDWTAEGDIVVAGEYE